MTGGRLLFRLGWGVACTAVLVAGGCAELEQVSFEESQTRELDAGQQREIGAVIAAQLETFRAVPTLVLDEFPCYWETEPCRDREWWHGASLKDASAVTKGFADALGIPVINSDDLIRDYPVCPWMDREDRPKGVWAEFGRPPEAEGDTSVVYLITGCMDEANFERDHWFRLERRRSRWVVVDRL